MYETRYHKKDLSEFSFLITGGAGFIGSNLVEYFLKYGAKKVRVLDNLATGFMSNLEEFQNNPAFEFIEGDIRDLSTCKQVVDGIDYVCHQAALGSVPRSIDDPITSNDVNINGFLNILCAIKDNERVKRLVYAASSSTYGDSKKLPKVEDEIGRPLSPYAVTKYVNELYASVFAATYGLKVIGLRYFNVFGPKQSSRGAYAAVIPLFAEAIRNNARGNINGDGGQTRDFTFIENVVQANVKAIFVDDEQALNNVYNIAFGQNISLNDLWSLINKVQGKCINAEHRESRVGDIRDSLADISKAKKYLGYEPLFDLESGLVNTFGTLL